MGMVKRKHTLENSIILPHKMSLNLPECRYPVGVSGNDDFEGFGIILIEKNHIEVHILGISL
jgi:hypothetical protein